MRPGVTGDEIDRVVYQAPQPHERFATSIRSSLVWDWQACIDRKIYPSPLRLGHHFGTAALCPVSSSAAEELLSLPQDALRFS